MRKKEREYWVDLFRQQEEDHRLHLAEIERAHRREREALLERIQRPEFRPVEPGEKKEYPEPTDAKLLSHIGQEVPDGILNQNDFEDSGFDFTAAILGREIEEVKPE